MNPLEISKCCKLKTIILSLVLICNVSFSQITKQSIKSSESEIETELEINISNSDFIKSITSLKSVLIEIPKKEIKKFSYQITKFDYVKNSYSIRSDSRIKVELKGVKKTRTKNYAIINVVLGELYGEKIKVAKRIKLKFTINKNSFPSSISKLTKQSSYSKFVKLKIPEDAIYRIYGRDLIESGIDISQIKANTLKLTNNGLEKSIFISTKSEMLGESDYIEFIGTRNYEGKHREVSKDGPYNEYLNRYTDTSTYFLSWDNVTQGKRTDIIENNFMNADSLLYLYRTIHIEKNNWFDFYTKDPLRRELPFWWENKTWIEGTLGVGKKRVQVNLEDLYSGKPTYIYSKFMDFASSVFTDAHLVSLKVNNDTTNYDLRYFNKYEKVVLSAIVDSKKLNSGLNNIYINSYPTNASVNSCFYDWTEIEYPVKLKLKGSYGKLSATNITGKYKLIFDSDNKDYRIWKNDSLIIMGSKETNKVIINDSLGIGDYYFISSVDSIKKPIIINRENKTNLKSSKFNSDYLILTTKTFYENAKEYAQFIGENYDVNAGVVLDDDIYDSYSYGYKTPEAIRAFLKDCYYNLNEVELKYLFIIGDASYDYYNYRYKATGVKPGKNIVPSFGAPVSDSYLAIWDSSFIPNINIGRLTVESIEELQLYFDRHRNYLSQPYDDWNKRFILFSGGNVNNNYELSSLKGTNDLIKGMIDEKIGGEVNHFYKTKEPLTSFGPYDQTFVNKKISEGALFISYLGHSGTQTWDNSITSPEQLLNEIDRYPLVTDFGCSTAKFAEPDITSFSELFTIKENSQAIAYIGNSALGFLNSATIFPKYFYGNLMTDTTKSICEILNKSKKDYSEAVGVEGTNKIFLLANSFIGDPIIKIKLPTKPNLSINNNGIKLKSQYSSNESYANLKIYYYNLGSISSKSFSIKLKDDYNGESNNIIDTNLAIPSYKDSLDVKIPIKDKPGIHNLSIELDKENRINEIYENDNLVNIELNVTNEAYKLAFYNGPITSYDKEVIIIKPYLVRGIPQFKISKDINFKNIIKTEVQENDYAFKLNLEKLENEKRYWLKISDKLNEDNIISFRKSKSKFSLFDSLSFANTNSTSLSFSNEGIKLDSVVSKLFVSSAGFIDGNSTVITLNGEQLVPENTLRGHHICVFQKDPLKFIEYKRFDLFDNRTATEKAYKDYLSSLDSNYIVAIGITDEGTVYSTELKSVIKSFGSKEIDNLKFRDSWAFIGFKGASETDVAESLVKIGNGRARAEKEYKHISNEGILQIENIRSLSKIDSIKFIGTGNSLITVTIDTNTISYQISDNTLLKLNNKVTDQLKVKILSNDKNFKLEELNLYGANKPEIILNNNSIKMDSIIEQGETKKIKLLAVNISMTGASNAKELVVLSNDLGLRDTLVNKIINIPENYNIKDSVNLVSTNLKGNYKIDFMIFSDDYYQENNFSTKEFYVRGDTTRPELKLLINNDELFTGNYVTPYSKIIVELNDDDKVEFGDSSLVEIRLDGKKIPFDKLTYEFPDYNPKLRVYYNAELSNGEHELVVQGKDPFGNLSVPEIIRKKLIVSDEGRVFDLYNYPNPFAEDTYFTFSLSQIPDELKIKVFTISGRLIKEIKVGSENLKLNFNKIYWDGKDNDMDEIGNGVYLAKMIFDFGKKKISKIIKLAKVK